jgi:hypothetical protein
MSKKYRFKNVIDKLEAIYCCPLYYTVPLYYAIFSWKIFHPKNRVLENSVQRSLCSHQSVSLNFREVSAISLFTSVSKFKFQGGCSDLSVRGPDGTAEDSTAEDATAEDGTAELCKKGWTLRQNHMTLTLLWTLRRNSCHSYNNHVVNFLITMPSADNL